MTIRSIDQILGYFGQDRFVLFYYEPRDREVRWRDSHSNGTGVTGWPAPFADLEAQARACGISLGNSDEPGDHVLLVDRMHEQACFAYREAAQEFLARTSASAA